MGEECGDRRVVGGFVRLLHAQITVCLTHTFGTGRLFLPALPFGTIPLALVYSLKSHSSNYSHSHYVILAVNLVDVLCQS